MTEQNKADLAAGAPIEFTYRNWRGETARRKAVPLRLWYGATGWHPEPQWLMAAIDCEKQTERDFALVDMTFARLADAVQPATGEVDMRRVVEALGFDPENHHNAANCPYCAAITPPAQEPTR